MPSYSGIPYVYLALMILVQVKKSRISNFPKQGSDQNEKSFQSIEIWSMRRSTPLGGNFSVKKPLTNLWL